MEKEFRYSTKVLFQKGDEMRVSEGPYYESGTGNIYNMGVKGPHVFSHVDDDGNLWGRNKQGSLVLIYMGEEKLSESTGTRLRPHKLVKVRKKK